MENGFLYYPPDYADAIKLALNCNVGDTTIHDFQYDEDNDIWYVDATDEISRLNGIPLLGSLIRSCYKAVQQGTKSWT